MIKFKNLEDIFNRTSHDQLVSLALTVCAYFTYPNIDDVEEVMDCGVPSWLENCLTDDNWEYKD